MRNRCGTALGLAACLAMAAACSGGGSEGSANSAGTQATGGDGGGSRGLIPSLVNVDLRNVLNDLAVKLNLDRANIPINAQIPITLAVNICGVSINVLSVSTGGQANCTAKTTSPELAQVVQQQIAAGGSVGGGAQGGSTSGTTNTQATTATTPSTGTAPTTSTAPAASGTATGTQPAGTTGTQPAGTTTQPAGTTGTQPTQQPN